MKDFFEFSKTITEAHAKLKALEAECLKETGMRYDDKALEMACRYLTDNKGSCPLYMEGWENTDINCKTGTCTGKAWQCWMKYFREKE